MTTRRNFLKLVAASAALVAVPAPSAPVPVIVGDGVHDDTAGLQAALNGEVFEDRTASGVAVKREACGALAVAFGTSNRFRLTDALHLGYGHDGFGDVKINGGAFEADHDGPMFSCHGRRRFDFGGATIRGHQCSLSPVKHRPNPA